MHRPILALAFGLAVAGCGDPSGARTEDASIDAPLTLELLHEIGSFDDVEQSLTRLRTALLLPSGELLLPQPQDGEIRRYDAAGTLVGTIGRRGEGPGEFGSVGSMALYGDTLRVHDSGNAALHHFDLEGRHLSTTSWPPATQRAGEALFVWGYAVVPRRDGRGVEAPSLSVRAGARLDLEGYPVGLVDPTGEPPTDTVLHVTPAPFVSRAPEGARELIQSGALVHPFRDGEGAFAVERWVPGRPDRATFRVWAVSVAGDTLFDRTYPYTPIAADAARVRDEFMAGVDEELRSRFADVELWVPEALPPVTTAVDTSEGLIWLAREEYTDPRAWWALDRGTGEVVATIGLPPGEMVVDQRGDELVTVYEDEFEVPYVRRYRMAR